jgi:hypothetical protein
MLDKRWRRPKKTVCAASSVSEYAAILFYAGVISEHFMPSSNSLRHGAMDESM